MIPRVTFLLIAAFWVAMNVLLWRAEYGSHGSGISVPVDLVWRKILTAPDISSLTVYQDGQRTGFCEFSTSVEQAMAALDEDKPCRRKASSRARAIKSDFNGNVSLGDFTNRVTFDGRIQFSPSRDWRELNLKLSTHSATVEIHSLAAEPDGSFENHQRRQRAPSACSALPICKIPNALLHAFAGDLGGGLVGRTGFARCSVQHPRRAAAQTSNGRRTATG